MPSRLTRDEAGDRKMKRVTMPALSRRAGSDRVGDTCVAERAVTPRPLGAEMRT
jgi:hypothetical protein